VVVVDLAVATRGRADRDVAGDDRRPARTSHVVAFVVSMFVFGSPDRWRMSFALSPVLTPLQPQCHGRAIWWTVRSPSCSGRIRSVTFARASISPRSVMITSQPPSSMPRDAASTGSISANISGWSSDSHGSVRLIPPTVWCSVSRNVVSTHGQRSLSDAFFGLSSRAQLTATGLAPMPG
jgi:hypothetical protein